MSQPQIHPDHPGEARPPICVEVMGHRSSPTRPRSARRDRYLRHSWPVRAMHWINLVALVILLMSGLQIFNADPTLYWGRSSYNGRSPLLQLSSETAADGSAVGITEVLGRKFRTTGVLGLSKDSDGELTERGFPSWLTIPGPVWLAMGRRWHFFFAWILVINGACYVVYSFWSGHLSKDLAPTRRDWRSIGRSIVDHLHFRHPEGDEAKHYNVLQKLAYLVVIFGLLPFMILMGIAMSPHMDSLFPGWVDLFGGRQSARTLHFITANLIVLFVLIHVFEVVITGWWNNLRSMITGRYEIMGHVTKARTGDSIRARNVR
ncbi:MAG: cytochrome b/b6 domain-containing protein [Steroidobacteraceae bacterium]